MNWFRLALFLHIAGVLILFAAMAVEMVGVVLLRRATVPTQVKDAGFILSKLERVFSTSGALIFLSGVYMTVLRVNNHESLGWVVVAIVLFLAMAASGMITGKRTGEAVRAGLSKSAGQMTPSLQNLVRHSSAQTSVVYGPFAMLGLVALMVYKPSVVVSIVIAAATLLLTWLTVSRLYGAPHHSHMQPTSRAHV